MPRPDDDRAAGPALLHNMSVPSRSTLTCSREALPGRRRLVSCAGPGSGSGTFDADAAMRALDRHGAAGLAALLALLEDGGPVTAESLEGRIARLPGPVDIAEVDERVRAAAARAGLPGLMGVCIDVSAAHSCNPRFVRPLNPVASLSVMARRTGPLYVPSRAVEPSLTVLRPFVLAFPEELA